MKQHLLPNRMLPAIVLILNAVVELTGEPFAQNWCGRHEEGEVALRMHKIPELILNHHEKWVQAIYIGVRDVVCDPCLSFGQDQFQGRLSMWGGHGSSRVCGW